MRSVCRGHEIACGEHSSLGHPGGTGRAHDQGNIRINGLAHPLASAQKICPILIVGRNGQKTALSHDGLLQAIKNAGRVMRGNNERLKYMHT
ncbi:hypothetical protein CULCOIPH001_03670 [Corynebacterium ulcerans]|nr:hypothetical protein CULCOIPH001_03670 [Corynebacterium ulcerans]